MEDMKNKAIPLNDDEVGTVAGGAAEYEVELFSYVDKYCPNCKCITKASDEGLGSYRCTKCCFNYTMKCGHYVVSFGYGIVLFRN